MRISNIVILLLASVAISLILHIGYITIAAAAWNEGCNEAALKLKKDYGDEYGMYMNRFCKARTKAIIKYLEVEEE
jgi:hypothetical protein